MVRPAREDEAEMLGALALRSKAHWGYDDTFMEACRDDLTVTREALATRTFLVAEEDGHLLGFASLEEAGPGTRLDHLFVVPEAIGRGVGRRLWEHVLGEARARGHASLLIESDPHAEEFYRAMGAERIGSTPSTAIPGRDLPLLRYTLTFPGDAG